MKIKRRLRMDYILILPEGEQLLLPFPAENKICDRPAFRGVQLRILFEDPIFS